MVRLEDANDASCRGVRMLKDDIRDGWVNELARAFCVRHVLLGGRGWHSDADVVIGISIRCYTDRMCVPPTGRKKDARQRVGIVSFFKWIFLSGTVCHIASFSQRTSPAGAH